MNNSRNVYKYEWVGCWGRLLVCIIYEFIVLIWRVWVVFKLFYFKIKEEMRVVNWKIIIVDLKCVILVRDF